MLIENGGSGPRTNLKVDTHNRAATTSVTGEYDFVINAQSGKCWTIPFDGLNPDGDDDYILYIKNTGDKVLHITDIRIIGSATGRLDLEEVEGTASGGNDISPVSKTIGSSASIEGVIQSGTNITGISSQGNLYKLQCENANKEYHLHTRSTIRIPKNKAIGFLAKTGTTNFSGTISLVEEENGFA